MSYVTLWLAMAAGSVVVGLVADVPWFAVAERIWFIGTAIFACWFCFGRKQP